MTSDPLEALSARQKALYWLIVAEATSLDERMMLAPTLARKIRATMPDVIAVREVLLSGYAREQRS